MTNYIPKKGDKINVFRSAGLYSDRIKGAQTSDNYEILSTEKNDCFGDIEIKSLSRGTISIVELNWFNTELTGRKITLL